MKPFHRSLAFLEDMSQTTTTHTPGIPNFLRKVSKRQPLNMIAIGGSNTAGGDLESFQQTYFNLASALWNKHMYETTGSRMTPYGLGIGNTGSDVFSFCFQNFLPEKPIDIVLIDEAVNDRCKYYGKGAQPMELLTRRLLLLPTKPLIIYVNLVSPQIVDGIIQNVHCKNMQDFGFDELAKHYGIPVISMRDFVCPLISSGTRILDNSKLDMYVPSGNHVNEKAHYELAVMIVKYLTQMLIENDGKYFQDISSPLKAPLFSEAAISDNQLSQTKCFAQLTPNYKLPLKQTLSIRVVHLHGFKYYVPGTEPSFKPNSAWRLDASGGWVTRPGHDQVRFKANFTIDSHAKPKALHSVAVLLKFKQTKGFSIRVWLNDNINFCTELSITQPGADLTFIRVVPVGAQVLPGHHSLYLQGKAHYLHVIGVAIGYPGFRGYEGYKPFGGTERPCP